MVPMNPQDPTTGEVSGEGGADDGIPPTLADLSAEDLAALRLGAQVMAHRAALAGLPRVAHYFERIEAETIAEQAATGQRGHGSAEGSMADVWVVPIVGDSAMVSEGDRREIGEYLQLLAANEALPPSVRAWCRGLLDAERVSSGQHGRKSSYVSQHRPTQRPR
jgi:hypothetical protein